MRATAQERAESELVSLRKVAAELARARKERVTTVHLLASIAQRGGVASELLSERGLGEEALLKAGRSFDEDGPDSLGRALTEAREVAKRSRGRVSTDDGDRGATKLSPDSRLVHTEPTGLHLLLALLSDRRSAAHRALFQCGVDVARLRTAALQLAIGFVATRRPNAREGSREAGAPSRARDGVSVPLVPPIEPAPSRPPRAASVVPFKPTLVTRPASAPPPPVSAPTPPPAASPSSPGSARVTPPAVSPHRSKHAFPLGEHRRSVVKKHAPKRGPAGPKKVEPPALAGCPTLAAVGKDLSALALAGELAPVVGRDAEIERVLDVLGKRSGNSPCLVGPVGSGKTSVARGVAQKLVETGDRRRLIELGVSALVQGTGARGALAERVATIREEVRASEGSLVVFVDEIHELFALGDEVMAEIKAALAEGDLPLVGATSVEGFKKAVEGEPALLRRFTAIEVEEPAEEDAFLMVRSAAYALEEHHGLTYADAAIAAAVSWTIRYVPGRALPDKAVSALDLAGARARRRAGPRKEGFSLGLELDEVAVGVEELANVIAELADVPRERLLATDRERMLALETELGARVVGHQEAIARIATHVRRNAAGLRGRRPIGSFLLLGPTGVGKTETAKALAEALFGSDAAMTRIDLSEYAEPHSVARLIGAPPGYVGFEAGGQLTEALRRRPYQVVLLDEIEKAHRDVLEAFLQVFDEGHLTDGRGRRVDFTNSLIVLTSNLGAREVEHARSQRGVGFAQTSSVALADLELLAQRAAKKALPPELYNRLDEVLFFAPLTRDEVATIAKGMLTQLRETLFDRGVVLEIEDAAVDALCDAGGFDPELGARPMRRTIARLVEAPLAELLLRGELADGGVALVGAEDGKVVVDCVPKGASAS